MEGASGNASSPTTFSLRGRPNAITLEDGGFHHPSGARSGSLEYTPYPDVTHLAASTRALWLGTRRSAYVIARRSFVDPNGPENVVRALLDRIASHPDGASRLARMAQIEETARTAEAPRATWGLAALCAALYLLELGLGDTVHGVGYFTRALAADGDWWRFVTGNLLHAGWLHLALNLMGLSAIGSLLEHSIGSARTVIVMAVSGLGSMLASGWWSDLPVVGVSGVICGLIGGLLWLEWRFADALPAWWRVPRRALYWAIGATALLGLLPFVAGAAHAGGFVAGGLAVAVLCGRDLASRPSTPPLRLASALAILLVAAGIGAAGWEAFGEPDYAKRQMVRLGRLPGATPDELNNAAWTIAIDRDSPRELLDDALVLARRAVDETKRREPYILDTLAEVHFRLGDAATAVSVIEEAIRLAPLNRYYREQRERFLGERPAYPAPWEEDAEPERDWDTPGLTV